MKPTAMLSPNGEQTTQGEGPAARLLVATVKGVVTLERPSPGATWVRADDSIADLHVSSLLFEPGSGKLFAGAHGDGGVWVSDDGEGASWRPVANGLTSPDVYSLAARRSGDAVTIFAGVEPATLFRSDDLGENWRELPALRNVPGTEKWCFPAPPHIAHVKSITIDQSRSSTLYTCVEQGALLKSDDDGENWVEFDSYVLPDDSTYRDAHRLVIHPDNPDILYLATGLGLSRSDDGGETWTSLHRRGHDRIGYPDFLCFDPDDRDVLYMGGGADSPTSWMSEHIADAAVLKSLDGGRTWREMANGLPSPMIGSIEAMSLHQWAGGKMLTIATATGQVYVSEDAGESWSCVVDDLAPVSKGGHYRAFLKPPAPSALEGASASA